MLVTRPDSITRSTKQNQGFSVDYDKNNEIAGVKIKNFSGFLSEEWHEHIPRERLSDVNGHSELIINEPKTIVVLLDALDGIIKLHEQ